MSEFRIEWHAKLRNCLNFFIRFPLLWGNGRWSYCNENDLTFFLLIYLKGGSNELGRLLCWLCCVCVCVCACVLCFFFFSFWRIVVCLVANCFYWLQHVSLGCQLSNAKADGPLFNVRYFSRAKFEFSRLTRKSSCRFLKRSNCCKLIKNLFFLLLFFYLVTALLLDLYLLCCSMLIFDLANYLIR